MRFGLLSLPLAITLAACGADLSDAERIWCADHPRSVAASMGTLDLLTPIQGASDLELWVAVLDGYFGGDSLDLALLSDDQEQAANRGCGAAFRAR